jgi:hypothetical protein
MFAPSRWLLTAMAAWCAYGRAAAAQKKVVESCAAPGAVEAETRGGLSPTVSGTFPGLYGPAGERASDLFQHTRGAAAKTFHSVVQLIPMSGLSWPIRRTEVSDDERFDFGDVRPGHYVVRVDFSFRGPVVGEFDIRRAPVSLCLGLPSNPLQDDAATEAPAPAAPAHPAPAVQLLAPSQGDSLALGAAIGQYYGSRMMGPQPPFALVGGRNSLVDAVRRSLMVARGDGTLPALSHAARGPWSTLSVGLAGLTGPDSALVTTTFTGCRPANPGITMSAKTQTYLLVREGAASWTVAAPAGPATTIDGHCE